MYEKEPMDGGDPWSSSTNPLEMLDDAIASLKDTDTQVRNDFIDKVNKLSIALGENITNSCSSVGMARNSKRIDALINLKALIKGGAQPSKRVLLILNKWWKRSKKHI